MAALNPDVQQNQTPNFLGYSRGTSQPQGDTTLGELFKGIASNIEAGVKGLDYVVKSGIEDETRSKVQGFQETFIEGLEGAYTQGTGVNLNLVSENAPDKSMPGELTNVRQTVSNLQASSQAKIIPKLHYLGTLNSYAKELRNKYPGYREFIDKEISSVTGVNVANAYISALTEGINASLTAAQDDYKNTRELVEKYIGYGGTENVPGAHLMLNYLDKETKAGRLSGAIPVVRQWVHERAAQDETWKRKEQERQTREQSRDEQYRSAISDLNLKSQQIMGNNLETVLMSTGQRIENITDYVNQIKRGEIKLSEQDAIALAQTIDANADNVSRQLWTWASTLDSSGSSVLMRMSGKAGTGAAEDVRKVIEGNLSAYRELSKSLSDKSLAVATVLSDQINAAKRDDLREWRASETLGPVVRYIQTLNEIAGPYKDVIAMKLMTDIEPKLRTSLQEQLLRWSVQMNPTNPGMPIPMDSVIKHFKDKGVTDPKVYENIKNFHPSVMLDKDASDELKERFIQGAFSPNNAGFIDNFKNEGFNNVFGKYETGKQTVFNQWTSRGMTDEVQRLASGKPELWNRYVGWANNTFGIIFKREAADLNDLRLYSGVNLDWDVENKQFKIEELPLTTTSPEGAPMTLRRRGATPGFIQAKAIIDRLNINLQNLNYIHEKSGMDPEVGMINMLINMGFNPYTSGAATSIPEHILKRLIMAQEAERAEARKPGVRDIGKDITATPGGIPTESLSGMP